MWSRTPLRIKLVATLVTLVTAALAFAGVAAVTSLRGYLFDRVDAQLAQAARDYADGRRGPGGGPGGPGPGRQQYWARLIDSAGHIYTQTSLDDDRGEPDLDRSPARAVELYEPFTVDGIHGNGVKWRVVGVPWTDAQPGGMVLVARDITDETNTVHRLVTLELLIGVAVVVLLGAVGYVLVSRSLWPLLDVEETAEAIAAGDLSRRVPEADPRTEVGRLSAALNAMLQQIESSFRVREASERRMRRFLSDASHELRTPLTSIRGFAELYRQGAATPEELPRLMRRIEDEGARMGLLVDDLLLLARLDEERPLARTVVDLVPLATDAVHDARAVDPDRDVTLDVVGTRFAVVGDEPRLRQVLANLVGNARKHTPAGTPIEVRLQADDGYVAVEVVDHGPGLSPEDAERVFERFFRASESRTRAEGGAGLGLAIVAALAEAHGGSVAVRETPGGGATFSLRLPLAP